MIYLDYNATTPVDPRVAEAMLPYLTEHFGNPSSSHQPGRITSNAVSTARGQVAAMLHASPDEIIFTSGGSESNNYAIKGVFGRYAERGNHVITSAVEHPAVMEVCRYLQSKGAEVSIIDVDASGRVNPEDVRRAIRPETILVSIMHANNEIGTVQPIREIADIAHEANVLVHTDAAQSIGKIPVHIDELGVDLLSVAAHKLYAPKGIGALFVRKGVELEKQIHGANHENGWRAGTENVLEIVGLGKACELVREAETTSVEKLENLRNKLIDGLRKMVPDLIVHGNSEHHLPNTASVALPGFPAAQVIDRLGDQVAISAGSACHSDKAKVSGVLKAINAPVEATLSTLRISVGRFTTPEEIDSSLAVFEEVFKDFKA